MGIGKGQSWGHAAPLPTDGVVVACDAEARRLVEQAQETGVPPPVLGLTGGDLWRTLGGSGPIDPGRLRSEAAVTFRIDVGEVLVDGHRYLFVAHLVAHNRSWRRVLVAMNAEWRGAWDLGPKSHPNDGLLDTYDARLPWGDLWKVRARLPGGAHMPHPGIKERRVAALDVDFDHPVTVELDGDAVARTRSLAIRLHPDALTVVV